MGVEVSCDGCGKRFSVSESLAGKRARCKFCGAVFSIPKLETDEPATLELRDDDSSNDEVSLDAMRSLAAHEEDSVAESGQGLRQIPIGPPPLPPPDSKLRNAELVSSTSGAWGAMMITASGRPMLARRPRSGAASNSDAPDEPLTKVMIVFYLLCHVVATGLILANMERMNEQLDKEAKARQFWSFEKLPEPVHYTAGGVVGGSLVAGLWFFIVTGPSALAGVYGASRIFKFDLPAEAYTKVMGTLATPSVVIGFAAWLVYKMEDKATATAIMVFAILLAFPIAFLVMKYSFGLRFRSGIVAYIFSLIAGIVGGGIVSMFLLFGYHVMNPPRFQEDRQAQAANESDRPGSRTDSRGTSGSSGINRPVPAPVDPNRDRLFNLRAQANQLSQKKLDNESRETMLPEIDRLQVEYDGLKGLVSDQSTMDEIARILADVRAKVMKLPSERMDTALFSPPEPKGLWPLTEFQKQYLVDEVAFNGLRIRLDRQMGLDFKGIDASAKKIQWKHSAGGAISIASHKRENRKQLRPWITRKFDRLVEAPPEGIFIVAVEDPTTQCGTINGMVFFRVGPAEESASLADGQSIRYITLLGEEWVEVAIRGPVDSKQLEILAGMVHGIRKLMPGDPPVVGALDPTRIALRLADEDADAAAELIKHGSSAEPVVLPYLKHEKDGVKKLAAKLLGDIGTTKSYLPLKALAKLGNSNEAGKAARASLRKLAPDEFDAVSEALLDMESDNITLRNDAMTSLSKQNADQRRSQVAPLLEKILLDKEQKNLHSEAARALAVWAVKETVPHLIPLLAEDADRQMRDTAMGVLAKLKDPRGVQPIIRWLKLEPGKVESALSQMGPVAEDELLRTLAERDADVRRTVVRILGEVGTEKCVRNLSFLATDKKDGSLASEAKNSLDKVRRRIGN